MLVFTGLCHAYSQAQVSPNNLLQNGDFESGGNGTGFQVPGPYNFLTVLSGNSNAGDVAVTANPQAMNTGFFFSSSDHSGTGKMLVVDGITTGGQQRFWKAGGTGGGVGSLTPGSTYRFSYWVKNISTTSNSAATSADIGVAWNNAGSPTLVSGSGQVPFPGGTTASWVQVVYSFVANSNFVNIELYNNNTSAVGNDFAIDDVEVLAPPQPLTLGYSLVDPICPGTSTGLIAAYAAGGTPPYSFSLNGGASNTTGIFTGLAASTGNFLTVTDAATPVNSVTTLPTITLTDPPGLTVRNDTTICAGSSVGLSASGGTGYTWTASPPDPTLTNPFSATPTVAPATTTVYTVKSSTSRQVNFIFNGDFSQGNLGFATDYNYFVQNTANLQTAYGIVSNANNFEDGFSSACLDHTGGGNMMVVDGAINPNLRVWEQTIPVLPATNYTFSYWIQTVAPNNPAQIKTLINGLPITGNATTSSANAPGTLCNWIQYTYPWNSGANTTAKITLINNVVQPNGNDFALDDISMVTTITCPNIQKNVTITVTGSTAPVTAFSYASPVCANATVNPAPVPAAGFAAGGTFTATPAGLSINPSTGVINLSASAMGIYTVTYSVAASGCISAGSSTASITIANTINAVTAFSYASPRCLNQVNVDPMPILSPGFTPGGTFSSTPAGLVFMSTATGQVNIQATAPGNYTITYTIPTNGCVLGGSSSAPLVITAGSSPVTGFSYPSPVCQSSPDPAPIPVAGFTGGGTYSSTAGLSINASTGVINLSASTPGAYTVTYSVAASGCVSAGSSTAGITITAGGNAVTSFAYNLPVCSNNPGNSIPVPASGFTNGGTYTASPAGLSINASTGVVNVPGSLAGSYTVTYTVAASGCIAGGSSTAPFNLVTSGNPVTSFSYSPNAVCQAAVNPVPVLAAGFTTGGFFTSSSGLSLNAASGTIDLLTSTPGTYTVQYQVAASGCAAAGSGIAAITIRPNDNPVTGFSYPTPVCISGPNPQPILTSGFTPGGTFTGLGGLSVNSSTGIINLSASSPGVYTISYNIAPTGCFNGGSGTANIQIDPNNAVVTGFSYPTPVCASDTNPRPIPASGFTTGGLFSSTPGLSVDPATGIINLPTTTAGNYVVSYTVPANACVLSNTGTASIVVNGVPAPPAVINAERCGPGRITLRANGSGALSWYSDSTRTIQVASGNVLDTFLLQTTRFHVTDSNINCPSTATPVIATINPLPPKPRLGNDTALCTGQSILLDAGVYNEYIWQDNSTAATYRVDRSGLYSVRVRSGGVCFASDTIAVNVLNNCDDVYFPTAFSPNGDGRNDLFGALGNVFLIEEYSLLVFNRFGEKVFATANPYQRWNGQSFGKLLEPGNYVYVAVYSYRGNKRTQKGNLMLMR